MFCPNCGSKENNQNQFCRSCGTNLTSVRVMLESPDSVTASAASARDEIGKAIAAKIQQTNDSDELSTFAEDVLPELEKFLESPTEKSLRRVRAGSMISFVGVGAMLGFALAAIFVDRDFLMVVAAGMITFFIGLAMIFNGKFFTNPQKQFMEDQNKETDNQAQLKSPNAKTNELLMPTTARQEFSSVTEHTTKNLKKER